MSGAAVDHHNPLVIVSGVSVQVYLWKKCASSKIMGTAARSINYPFITTNGLNLNAFLLISSCSPKIKTSKFTNVNDLADILVSRGCLLCDVIHVCGTDQNVLLSEFLQYKLGCRQGGTIGAVVQVACV